MKETYYFPHDYHARHDIKLQNLFLDKGVSGIGIYWCLVEMLYEEGGKMPLECERIAKLLQVHNDIIKSIINDYNLFETDKNNFWSLSVLRRLKERNDKSEKARISAKLRWNNANAMRTQCEGNAIKERKGKERKRKESKEKNIKDIAGIKPPAFSNLVIQYFKTAYTQMFGSEPAVAWEKDVPVVNRTKGLFKDDSWKQLIDWYLKSPKAEKCGYTVAICFSSDTINLWKVQSNTSVINNKDLTEDIANMRKRKEQENGTI